MRFKVLHGVAAAAALLAASPAAADRPPTDAERAAIEEALRGLGYTAWGKIEFEDDGVWEVDDAIDASGKGFELILTPEFEVLEKNPD